MYSLVSTAATLSVDDITALSDAQFTRFLTEHRRPDGNFELPVDGWDKLTKDERNHLADRLLKAQDRALAQSPLAFFRPLDLEQVNTRLTEFSNNRTTSSYSRTLYTQNGLDLAPLRDEVAEMRDDETEAYDEEDERADRIDSETEAYHDLANDGGRPLYPISLLEQVSRDPEGYRKMLWPFWNYPRDHAPSWLVFQSQLKRWQDFRKWQNDNRGLEDDDDGFSAYVKRRKRGCIKDGDVKTLAAIEADPEDLKSGDWWEYKQKIRRWQRRWQREHGCNGFSDYVNAVMRRLARHGFTRPFELQEDPKLQDKLTTWIEYLCFEYWWLDRYTDSIERLKPDHDRRWQELVDKKIPKPHETKDFIRTTPSSMQRQKEDDQAREAKRAAEAEAERVYFLTQKDSRRLGIPKEKRMRMLHAATKKVVAAKELYESTKRRNDLVTNFIRATFNYVDAKKDAAGHAALAQWVLEQVPLVEAEVIQRTMTEAGPDTTNKKRKRAQDADKPEKRSSKKRKPGHGEVARLSRSSRIGPANLGEASQRPPRTMSGKNCMARDEAPSAQRRQADSTSLLRYTDASPAPTQGLRRSARIAARLDNLQPTLAATLSPPPGGTEGSTASKIGTRKRGSSVQTGRVSKRLGDRGR
ncbi:hypothetical protein HIM_11098 [Hirsutella minnesotensis 3608]|uniref:Uncharacterized protein n=1 Tax=Hirsutella minnesotensis 3608 TaxID=1043627 RepID=A0A0F7ZFP5_9HYPO|nr:hypothetical protein HIM_11098 [Hirsutella minnesotensis 3608]